MGNPLVNMAAHQVEVKVNTSGYRKLHKANAEYRIDPISALTMAYGVAGKKGLKSTDYSNFDGVFGAGESESGPVSDDWSDIF